MHGCLIALIVVGCVSVGSCVAFGVLVAAVGTKSPKQQEREQQIAAQLASANAAREKEHEDRMRAACKRDSGPLFFADDGDIRAQCRARVQASLKAPSSAKFDYAETTLLTTDQCNRIFESSVEAQNPFGVMLRTPFTCTYDPRTGDYALKIHEP